MEPTHGRQIRIALLSIALTAASLASTGPAPRSPSVPQTPGLRDHAIPATSPARQPNADRSRPNRQLNMINRQESQL